MVLHQRMCIDEEKLVVPQECSEPPFDLFCPSIQSSLKDCICPTCGIQWPNKTAVSKHKKIHSKSKTVPEESEKDPNPVVVNAANDEPMPVVDVQSFIEQPWEDEY